MQYFATAPCVKPWTRTVPSNGGATAQGVTEDEIHVVVLIGDEAKDSRSVQRRHQGLRDRQERHRDERDQRQQRDLLQVLPDVGPRRSCSTSSVRPVPTRPRSARTCSPRSTKKPFAILCMACQVVRRGRRCGVRGVGGRRGVPANPAPATPQEIGGPQPAVPRGVRCEVTRRQAGEVRRRRRAEDRDAEVRRALRRQPGRSRHRGASPRRSTKYGGKESDLVLIPFTVPTDPHSRDARGAAEARRRSPPS